MRARIVRVFTFGLTLLLATICFLPLYNNSRTARAFSNGLAQTPPMGWNSWNRFGCDVSERTVEHMADAMVETGMRDAGYTYVVVDDCWQVGRDDQGAIIVDPQRFPHGMAALASYVHTRGLKFGLYTDVGSHTCMGRPGSLGHEYQDAATYAAWQVDYVKVDWCANNGLDAPYQYSVFRDALLATGRPMVMSICTWGQQNPWDWGHSTGHLWRTTTDIQDNWPSVLQIIRENAVRAYAAGPGGWNDPDMLEVGNGGMNTTEYRTHFSMWAMMAAPLIAGNDLSRMSVATRAILLNQDVIAIDQDMLGIPALIMRDDGGPQVWSRPLSDMQSRAVALFNPTDTAILMTVHWNEIGLAAGHALVYDLWTKTVDTTVDSFTARVEPHGTVMLKITNITVPNLPVNNSSAPLAADQRSLDHADISPTTTVTYPYLSDLAPTFAISGFGPIEHDMSNGEDVSGDGKLLTIGGQTYAKGLGVHAPADIRYNLVGSCSAFAADIGIDSEVGDAGNASFQVWADDALIYDSGVLHGSMAALPVYLDIPGVNELRLVVVPVGTSDYAHADWANARLACGGDHEQ